MSDVVDKADVPHSCYWCSIAYGGQCIACRSERLIDDIRSQMVDNSDLESRSAEWEKRALKAEAALRQAEQGASEAKGVCSCGNEIIPSKCCGCGKEYPAQGASEAKGEGE